jgi:hypothetical protein
MGKQPFPMRSPGAFGRGRYDFPGHRDGAAADDDPEVEDGEALAQRGGIHRQRQRAAIGGQQLEHPAQQWRETGGDIHLASFAALCRARLVAGSAIPVAQALEQRLVALLEQRGQQHAHRRQAATLRQHRTETPQRQHLPLWCAEMREMG